MPRVIEVEEALALSPDTFFESLAGVIQEVYQPKSGEGAKGPWSFQCIILRDRKPGSSKSVEVKLWNLAEPLAPKSKGCTVIIERGDDQRSGLQAKEDTFKKQGDVRDTTKFVINADNCTVSIVAQPGERPAPPPPPRENSGPPDRTPPPAQQSQPQGQPAQQSDEIEASFGRAKKALIVKANCLVLCMEGVDYADRSYRALHKAKFPDMPQPQPLSEAGRIELIKTLSMMGDKCGAFDGVPAVNMEKRAIAAANPQT